MTPERWQKIKDICSAAVDSEPDARRALLQELCAGDDELRRSVEAMIADACSEETAQTSSPRRDAAVQFAAAAVDGRDWKPGVIGRFRTVRVVGEGGMGVVYEARQDHPRRMVALKVIKPGLATPELLRRFQQESHALGRLQHPGIAQIYEAGTFETGIGAAAVLRDGVHSRAVPARITPNSVT